MISFSDDTNKHLSLKLINDSTEPVYKFNVCFISSFIYDVYFNYFIYRINSSLKF